MLPRETSFLSFRGSGDERSLVIRFRFSREFVVRSLVRSSELLPFEESECE